MMKVIIYEKIIPISWFLPLTYKRFVPRLKVKFIYSSALGHIVEQSESFPGVNTCHQIFENASRMQMLCIKVDTIHYEELGLHLQADVLDILHTDENNRRHVTAPE